MNIKYAIVSTDDNPMYYDFWPIVKDLWNNLIGITPILVHITTESSVEHHEDCIIHKIQKVSNINSGFQSQISRMYITKFYPHDLCITSDIDMLPLSREYFNIFVPEEEEDNMFILGADAYQNQLRYPLCYNVGKGSTFNEILDLNCTFSEYTHRLLKYNWGWDTDELYFGMKVSQYPYHDKIKKVNRGWEYGRALNRIDRAKWGYDVNKLKQGGYIDSHCLRPYSEYKEEIDKLITYTNSK